jgi:hypothetical protein
MGPVIAWCHGIAGPLILPGGDVHIWLDVPQDRRTSDEEDVYWGVLSGGDEPMFSFSRLPDQTDTWQRHRIQNGRHSGSATSRSKLPLRRHMSRTW